MPEMAARMNQETGGFKLLEEDALDDRPCPAVKKFVSSVLDRKDMKDQEVASSFRNLMEYRDSTSSPSSCSAATSSTALDGERLKSPPSPSSPSTAPGPMDDQRLPNELLDEICEDIGMKEGMELDFVEYLMEQDTNPQLYMTQEAITSGTFNSASGSATSTSAGNASGVSSSTSDSKTLTALNPATTTTPNFLFKPNFSDSEWLHPLPMSVNHSSPSISTGSTVAKSYEANSLTNKRMHSSASTDTGPDKRQSQGTSGFKNHTSTNIGNVHINTNGHSLFKMPHPGPIVGKRSQFYPNGSPSPVPSALSGSSQGSNSTCHSSGHPAFSRPQQFSPNASSCQHGSCDQDGNTASNITTNYKNQCMSPKPCDFSKPGSPGQLQGQSHFNSLPGSVGSRDGDVFQRVDKQQPPPNVSVKSMQQHQLQQQQYQQQSHVQEHGWLGSPQTQINHNDPGTFFNKGMHPGGSYQTHHPHVNHQTGFSNMAHMLGPSGSNSHQIRAPLDSPLDQGYFSNESAGNCSNGSASSPAFTTSSMSSFSSASTMMPADHSQQKFSQKSSMAQQQLISGTSGNRPPGQKSVHFSDAIDGSPPAYVQSPGNVSMDIKPSFDSGNGTVSNCGFEAESSVQAKGLPSGKILPRYNYSMKSGGVPYTVPNSQGQVMAPAVSPGYDVNTRPSCAMSVSGDRSSPGETMQEYVSKSCHINGGGGAFFVDSNQNMMRMDSVHDYPPFPPPLISPQSGEYIGMHPSHPRFGMNQFSSMQPQAPFLQQQSHQMSSTESMAPLHPHPQSIQHHRQQQQQLHPFSSYSHSAKRIESEINDHNNMQMTNSNTGGYQAPLAMSTVVSDRADCNARPACPPSYESSFGHDGQPDMYPSQHQSGPSNLVMMGGQQVSFLQRGWGPGVNGPEDLRVQIGSMHPNSMKGNLQTSHPQMQPSPTPACAAPLGLGPHMQELTMMNSGVHGASEMGPLHTHMDSHPEYGPCVGLPCNACKMNHTGNSLQHHPHLGPCAGPNCHTCKMNTSSSGHMSHIGPCAGPGCTACKMNQVNRPQMLSSQQKFIQHLIMDEGNAAYRSHPLFPLLRDLVIAEMNFDNPRFHYQQLLSLLPNDFHKLLQNFLHRNPPSGHYQSNQAVESVIMDSLRLAHGNLVDKIRHRQELEQMKANSSATLRSMEEFCQKFDHSVTGPMQGRPIPNGVGSMTLNHPVGGYHEGSYIPQEMGHMYLSMKDGPDMYMESTLSSTSPQGSKTESKKHPSLPKEAVAMMMEWLRNHKDNPYPNDDEKSMLIKQTGLSINQINYWFTNARRRILPKWSQCKT